MIPTSWKKTRPDPRIYQITILSFLLLYGVTQLHFEVRPLVAAAILATALATQFVCTKLWKLPAFDPKSALISGLSMCLLLRANTAGWLVAAAAIAVASKFVLRWNGKHLFNPTNGAIIALMLSGAPVWVSPGQWGNVAFVAFLMACLGGLVVNRAARADVTYAFIAAWCILLFGRSLWLGEPMTIPWHRLQSGSLLLFTFFMISDPKTTPDSREGRILFAYLVAAGAWYVHFRMFRTNGLLWSLAVVSMFTPLIDRLLPGVRYDWKEPKPSPTGATHMRPAIASVAALAAATMILLPGTASAFCGFYVAKADTKLFNKASQVALVRDGDRTVMTMANDFKGDMKEFAMVIPVPTFITKEQIHVGDKAILDHLDAYSSPRLVEYFDEDPCAPQVMYEMSAAMDSAGAVPASAPSESRAKSLGVKIEAQYTVGEYDILILSAKQSGGLETWLKENGYKIPDGASEILGSYIKQGMKFFVAKVNLKEQDKLGFAHLRPLQVAYESPKFMLPIRLGTVNADGPQELFVYALTRTGRVETTNYRTVKLPSDLNVPTYVKTEFGDFYKSMFTRQVEKEKMTGVFLEYAWDMNWCDPCAADPLSAKELRNLGVFWVGGKGEGDDFGGGGGAQDVFLTRLHVRYDRAHFPEDLVFQATADRANFQGRYILQHAFEGEMKCDAAKGYQEQVRVRQEREAKTLADLTGWKLETIRAKMKLDANGPPGKDGSAGKGGKKWYESIWSK